MLSLSGNCELVLLSNENPIINFNCDNDDLNDFFCNDAIKYQEELLGQTYFFRNTDNNDIVCAFTLSNDSIKTDALPNNRKKVIKENIPHVKSQKSYPATLIGRLGVSKNYARNGIGSQLLDFIKSLCLIENSNKCRFLLVDAYNTEIPLNYYKKNDFIFVFSTEMQEKTFYNLTEEDQIKTRFMCFDLKKWTPN